MRWLVAAVLAACAATAPAQPPLLYRVGGDGDAGGIDCSGYVNRVLADSRPRALAALRHLRPRPRAREYAELLARGGSGWEPIARIDELRPGDVLAWEYEPGSRTTGHVAVAAAAPEPDPRFPNAWRVRVRDAARSGHSDDTRARGVSGIGEGTLLIETDDAGRPLAYAWSLRAHWQPAKRIAMGRPID
jgi:hypothetical protein